MIVIIKIGIFFLNIIYFFQKIPPVRNRIVFISRQSNEVPVDIDMLAKRIRTLAPAVSVKTCVMMIPAGLPGKIKYLFHMVFREMPLIASARVVILNGYSIPVSVLKHRSCLRVVQLWHAMGILKKFGYMALDSDEGASTKIANAMCMHKNYDLVICSSDFCKNFYAKSFRCDIENVEVCPLPRVDLLRDAEYMSEKANEIEEKYPELSGKKNILFVPTFRREGKGGFYAQSEFGDVASPARALVRFMDSEKFNLIVKLHPLQKDTEIEGTIHIPDYTSTELLSVADYVVTDYSAEIFEAAACEKPVFIFGYDYDEYVKNRGFCIDLEKEMPGPVYRTAEELMTDLKNGNIDQAKQRAFARKFVEPGTSCTDKLARKIVHILNTVPTGFEALYAAQRQRNNKARRSFFYSFVFPAYYKRHARKPVNENKVVFIEGRFAEISNSVQLMYDKLKRDYDFEVKTCFLRNGYVRQEKVFGRTLYMLREIADAKYVILDESLGSWCKCKIRPETVVLQLWHACGAFKKFSLSTADKKFGNSRRVQEKYPNNNHYSVVAVSSPEVVWAYEEAMGYSHESGVVQPLGTSRTDIFFDEKVIEAAHAKLHTFFAGIGSKKILLYAPTFRGRVAEAKAPDKLDLEAMCKELGDDWIVLIKQHPFIKYPTYIPPMCKNFAFDVTKIMTIEELLCVADICISDYSSLIFEYSLFNRPMIFFAYDLDEYFDWRGFYYPYDETFVPGPIVTETEEIIDYVKHPEKFDMDVVRRFREKFMSACDGHATDRILNKISGGSLEEHRLSTPGDIIYERSEDTRIPYQPKELITQAMYNVIQRIYDRSAAAPVKKNKVVVLANKNHRLSMMMSKLCETFESDERIEFVRMSAGAGKNVMKAYSQKREVARAIADAGFIFIEEMNLSFLRDCRLRPETKIVYPMLTYDSFFKPNTFVNRFADINHDRKLICTSSEQPLIEEKLKIGQLETDIFFDDRLKTETIARIKENAPGFDPEKKNVFFIVGTNEGMELDWFDIADKLSATCNLLVYKKLNKKIVGIFEDASLPFVSDKEVLRMTECLAIADCIVSDHDMLASIGLMGEKPIIFLGNRFDTMMLAIEDGRIRKFYKENLCSGDKIVEKIIDLAGKKVPATEEGKFILEKYFKNCDGHVAERLCDYIRSDYGE